MIRVSATAHRCPDVWRVRDALARHPLLSGAVAQIRVSRGKQLIVLDGWVLDQELADLASRVAQRTAGLRPVDSQLAVADGEGRSISSTAPY